MGKRGQCRWRHSARRSLPGINVDCARSTVVRVHRQLSTHHLSPSHYPLPSPPLTSPVIASMSPSARPQMFMLGITYGKVVSIVTSVTTATVSSWQIHLQVRTRWKGLMLYMSPLNITFPFCSEKLIWRWRMWRAGVGRSNGGPSRVPALLGSAHLSPILGLWLAQGHLS